MTDQELLDYVMTEPPLLELLLRIQQLIEKKNRWQRACGLAVIELGEVQNTIEDSITYTPSPEHFYMETGKNNE